MDKQAIFDRVAKHMLTQNAKSQNEYDCLYRGPNGTMCAVGCLIDDKHYSTRLENEGPDHEWVAKAIAQSLNLKVQTVENFAPLLKRLQSIHDDEDVEYWPRELEKCAQRQNLLYRGELYVGESSSLG